MAMNFDDNYVDGINALFPELDDINIDFEDIDTEITHEVFGHPGGSPKPVEDDPFYQPKLQAEFDGNQNSRIFYKRVTENGHRYELQVNQVTLLKITENETDHIGFIVVHSHPEWHSKTISCQNVLKLESKSKRKRKYPVSLNIGEDHKCPIKVESETSKAIYIDFYDQIYKKCHGGVVEVSSQQTVLITPVMISTLECDNSGKQIGKKESARETKLVLFPIQKALYEDIQNGAKNLVEISKEMVESRWEVPIQFLSYVREERDLRKALHTKGIINWPNNDGANAGPIRKVRYLEMCQELFEKLSDDERIEEFQKLEQRLNQIVLKKNKKLKSQY